MIFLISILVVQLKLLRTIHIPCPALWNYDDRYFVSQFPGFHPSHRTSFVGHIPVQTPVISSKKTSLEILSSSPSGPIPYVHYAEAKTASPSSSLSEKEDVKSVSFANFLGKMSPSDEVKGLRVNLTQEEEWKSVPDNLLLHDHPTFGGEAFDENDLEKLQEEMVDSLQQQSKTSDRVELKPLIQAVQEDDDEWMNEISSDDDLESSLDQELEELEDYDGQGGEVENVLMKKLKGSTSVKKRIPSRVQTVKVEDESSKSQEGDELNAWLRSKVKEPRFGDRKRPRDITSVKLPVTTQLLTPSPKIKKISLSRVKNLTFKTSDGRKYKIREVPSRSKFKSRKSRKKAKSLFKIKGIKAKKRRKPGKSIKVIPLPEVDLPGDDDDDHDDDDTVEEIGASKKVETGYIIVPESKKKYKKTDYFPFQYNVEMRSRKTKGNDDGNVYKLHELKEEEHLHEKKWKKKGLIETDQFDDSDESESADDMSFRVSHYDPDIFDNYEEKALHEDLDHFNVPSNGFRVDHRFVDWTERPIDMEKLDSASFKDLV